MAFAKNTSIHLSGNSTLSNTPIMKSKKKISNRGIPAYGTKSFKNITKVINEDIPVNTTYLRGIPQPLENYNNKMTTRKDIHQSATRAAINTNNKLNEKLSPKVDSQTIMNNPGVGNPRRIVPASALNTQKKYTLANNSESRIIHKTKYETGFRPSKALRSLIGTEGSANTVFADSKIDIRDLAGRNTLTQGSGFNSRNYHFPCLKSCVPKQDIERFCSRLPDQEVGQEVLQTTQVYYSVLNLKNQYLIHNTSAYFPMHFKIHVLKYKQESTNNYTAYDAMRDTVLPSAAYDAFDLASLGTDTKDAIDSLGLSVGSRERVPWYYQHGNIEEYSPVDDFELLRNLSFNLSLKGQGVYSSPSFRDNFEIVDTFEKKIPPGDFWNFSHVHNCGTGINAQDLLYSKTLANGYNTYNPFTFCYLFETKGVLCEGVLVQEGGRDTYIGASPTFYSYEFKTSMYYIKGSDQQGGPYETDNDGTSTTSRVHKREYVSDPYSGEEISGAVANDFMKREIFVLNSDITDDSSTTTPGKMYIPIVSSGGIRYGTKAGGDQG